MQTSTSQSGSQIVFSINVREWLRRRDVNESFPYISEPQEIACYSGDGNGRITFGGRENLKQYFNPPIGTNLNNRYETHIPKHDDDIGVETVVQAIKELSPSTLRHCNIVTYRNNLNKIGRTPYALSDYWELECCQIEGIVFLEIRITSPYPTEEFHRRITYQGYRFEAVCTNQTDKPVNPNEGFQSVSALNLMNHCIVLASEIDCTYGDPTIGDNPIHRYIELKTCFLRNERDYNKLLRFRYPKYWLQSFIAGVPTIVLGSRSDSGALTSIRTLQTRFLHSEACDQPVRRQECNWKPAVMLNFINDILSYIREACARNLGATIRLTYDPNDQTVYASLVDTSEMKLAKKLENCIKW